MPQFQEFDECPQCGIIVAKFKEKRARQWEDSEQGIMVEVPSEPADEPIDTPIPHAYGLKDAPEVCLCAACGVTLPATAKFCPSCGTRVG